MTTHLIFFWFFGASGVTPPPPPPSAASAVHASGDMITSATLTMMSIAVVDATGDTIIGSGATGILEGSD